MSASIARLRPFLALLVAIGLLAQQAPSQITKKTPPPSREAAQAQGTKAKPATPPQDEEDDSESDSPQVAKAGNYDIDPDTGDVSLEGDGSPLVTGRNTGFGLGSDGGGDESDLQKAVVQSSAYQRARREEAAKAEAAKKKGASPEAAALEAVLAQQAATEREIRSLRRDSENLAKQTQQNILAGANRDAKTTNAAADVEFAEAAASRRASSLAREKGYSLIPEMRTIEMRLLTFADSEQPGKFKAVVTNDVWDATFASIGIPRGTLARGFVEAASNDTDSRIRMTITEFILPSGDSIQLRIPDAVTDELGAPGPKAKVNHHWGTRVFTGVAWGLVGAVAASGTKSSFSSQATFTDVLQNNLAGQIGQAGQQSLQNGLQVKPTVQLKQGQSISMILGTNLYLIPWERFRAVIPAPNTALAR